MAGFLLLLAWPRFTFRSASILAFVIDRVTGREKVDGAGYLALVSITKAKVAGWIGAGLEEGGTCIRLVDLGGALGFPFVDFVAAGNGPMAPAGTIRFGGAFLRRPVSLGLPVVSGSLGLIGTRISTTIWRCLLILSMKVAKVRLMGMNLKALERILWFE